MKFQRQISFEKKKQREAKKCDKFLITNDAIYLFHPSKFIRNSALNSFRSGNLLSYLFLLSFVVEIFRLFPKRINNNDNNDKIIHMLHIISQMSIFVFHIKLRDRLLCNLNTTTWKESIFVSHFFILFCVI